MSNKTTHHNDIEKLYTVSGLARLLGISRQALEQRIKADKLPFNIEKVQDPTSGQIRLKYTPSL